MSKEEPIASGGLGISIEVYPTYVVIKKNMFKKVTIPIKRIDQIETSMGNTLVIHSDKHKHRVAFGTLAKAEEVRNAIYANM